MNINNALNKMLYNKSTTKRISNWINKGSKYYTAEWYNPGLKKTIAIQKETSGKYIVQLFSGGGSTLTFNKFLSKSVPLNKAKEIANKWMKR